IRHVRQHAIAQDAGVVDDSVQISEVLDGSVYQSLGTLPRPDAVAVGDGLAAHPLDLLDSLLGRAEVATRAVDLGPQVVDDDLGAVCSKAQSVLASDSSAGTSD